MFLCLIETIEKVMGFELKNILRKVFSVLVVCIWIVQIKIDYTSDRYCSKLMTKILCNCQFNCQFCELSFINVLNRRMDVSLTPVSSHIYLYYIAKVVCLKNRWRHGHFREKACFWERSIIRSNILTTAQLFVTKKVYWI